MDPGSRGTFWAVAWGLPWNPCTWQLERWLAVIPKPQLFVLHIQHTPDFLAASFSLSLTSDDHVVIKLAFSTSTTQSSQKKPHIEMRDYGCSWKGFVTGSQKLTAVVPAPAARPARMCVQG